MANERRDLASFPKNGTSRNNGANQGTCWMIFGRLNFCQNILVPRTMRPLHKSLIQARQNVVVIPIKDGCAVPAAYEGNNKSVE